VTSPRKKLINGVAPPDIIARTGANIVYRGPAFALLDSIARMPAEVTVSSSAWAGSGQRC
jgi:hypothetical protein